MDVVENEGSAKLKWARPTDAVRVSEVPNRISLGLPSKSAYWIPEIKWNIDWRVTGLRMLEGAHDGWIGLAQELVREGHILALVAGANVLFVPRPADGSSRVPTYKPVSLCYIHGVMNGEALDLPGGF